MSLSLIRKNRTTAKAFIILAIFLVLAGLVWVNFQFSKNNPGGNDFLAHYVGTRALLFEGKSPYSDEVAIEIQERVFGRPAEPGEIEHRVVYPLYSVLVFSPFALIGNYAIARVAWMTVMEIALLIMGYLALQICSWKPKLVTLLIYFQFCVLWYHGFRAVINGNAVIVVALFITLAIYALMKEQDRAAGIFLALSTIKPNLVVLLIIFVLIWGVYKKRNQMVFWFLGSMLVMIFGAMLLIPDWIMQNIWEIIKYPGYNPPGTIAEVIGYWLPDYEIYFKWGIGGLLGLILGYEVWAARKANFDHFLWAVCLVLTISQWIGIATDPGNFVILFMPLVLVLARLDERWKSRGNFLVPSILGVVFIALWILFVVTLDFDYQPMQSSIMFFPLPAFVLLGLYWIKWWVAGGASVLLLEDL
jgi:hypothetical protein